MPTPSVHIAPIPFRFGPGLLEQWPNLDRDFWFVEHQIHRALESAPAAPLDSADYVYLPHYTMCEYAMRLYRRGWDPAILTPRQHRLLTAEVRDSIAAVVDQLRQHGSWNPRTHSRLLLAFGQGRGASQGHAIERFPEIRAGRFIGVEARPPNRRGFRIGHDVVAPPHVAHAKIALEVADSGVPRRLLAHFRGRSWGPVRQIMFRQLAGVCADVVVEDHRPFALGAEGHQVRSDDVAPYYREMAGAVFALCPPGITAWTMRFYEAMLVGCIPVLVGNSMVPAFADEIDYSRCTVAVPTYDLARLPDILRAIPDSLVADMLDYQRRIRPLLSWSDQAPAALLRALARRGRR